MDAKTIKNFNKQLAEWSTGKTSLQNFPKLASALDPAMSEALEGIYCGRHAKDDPAASARANTQIPGTNKYITFGWYGRKEGFPPVV